MTKLTEQQIKQWRLILFQQIGSFAWVMSTEHIQAIYERFQEQVDAALEKRE